MKKITLFLCIIIFTIPFMAEESSAMDCKVDQRVELLSIICHLADYPEYNRVFVLSYQKDIRAYFAKFQQHSAIKLARELRQKHGISYNAPMDLAVHLNENFDIITSFDVIAEEIDKRWNQEIAIKFIMAAKAFAIESGFSKFFAEHQELYSKGIKRLQEMIQQHGHTDWVPAFFGMKASPFHLVINILGGPMNYATRCKKNNELHIYSIVGVWTVDDSGTPVFPPEIMPTIIHEFCHTFVNPVVDEYEEELKASSQILFSHVAYAMKRQAYDRWQYMIYESVVRACVAHYVLEYNGELAAQQQVLADKNIGFLWMTELTDILKNFKKSHYKNFAEFFPEIVSLFDTYSVKLEQYHQKSPKIISMTPTNNSSNVSVHLTKFVVAFDRRMRDQSWSVIKMGNDFPTITGQVHYDEAKMIFTMPMKLESGKTYEFLLNAPNNYGFISEEGIGLSPVVVKFTVK